MCQDRFGRFFWSKIDCIHVDVKLKVFKKTEHKDFRLVQSATTGEAGFKQFMRLRTQLVIAAKNFGREADLSPVLIPTISKDMELTTQTGSEGG